MSAAPVLRRPPVASARLGLGLLTHDLHRDILRELAKEGPLTRSALAARLHTSGTKLHECLQTLRDADVVFSRRRGRAVEYSITAAGRQLDETSTTVARWSLAHPGNPLTASVGWRAFADFGNSWRTGLVEWIVRCAPTQEDVASGFDVYRPAQLRETLEAMSEAGMVTRRKGREGLDRHHLSSWAARAVGILAVIARWEQRHEPPGYAPIEVADAVVALRSSLSLVRLQEGAAGVCTFAVEAERQGPESRFGTVWARVRSGRVVGTGEGAPPEQPSGWVTGTFAAWFSAALDGRDGSLRRSGRSPTEVELVDTVIEEIHHQLTLYGS
jgi:DNA-binding HxlR family transcriptional regulator